MPIQELLDKKGITKYRLSKITGIPKTTIMDICSGRSDINKCSAHTVQLLSQGLGCTMEDIMNSATSDELFNYDESSSLYEKGIPDFLIDPINRMKDAWNKLDQKIPYLRWDCDYCDLQSEINNAEVNQVISAEQARYLRKKYLRMEGL